MEGINVSASLRTLLLKRVLSGAVAAGMSSNEFDLILSLNPQAREQFVQLFLEPDTALNNSSISLLICSAWAGKVLSGSAGRLVDLWNAPIIKIALRLQQANEWRPDASIANWMALEGFDPNYNWQSWDAIACATIYNIEFGFLWRCIHERFAESGDIPTSNVLRKAITSAHGKLKRGAQVPEQFVDGMRQLVGAQETSTTLRTRRHARIVRRPWRYPEQPDELDKRLKEALICALCAMRELQPRSEYRGGPIEDVATGFWDGDFEPAVKLRSISTASQEELSHDPELILDDKEFRIVNEFLKSIASWLRDWFYGRIEFVEVERSQLF